MPLDCAVYDPSSSIPHPRFCHWQCGKARVFYSSVGWLSVKRINEPYESAHNIGCTCTAGTAVSSGSTPEIVLLYRPEMVMHLDSLTTGN